MFYFLFSLIAQAAPRPILKDGPGRGVHGPGTNPVTGTVGPPIYQAMPTNACGPSDITSAIENVESRLPPLDFQRAISLQRQAWKKAGGEGAEAKAAVEGYVSLVEPVLLPALNEIFSSKESPVLIGGYSAEKGKDGLTGLRLLRTKQVGAYTVKVIYTYDYNPKTMQLQMRTGADSLRVWAEAPQRPLLALSFSTESDGKGGIKNLVAARTWDKDTGGRLKGHAQGHPMACVTCHNGRVVSRTQDYATFGFDKLEKLVKDPNFSTLWRENYSRQINPRGKNDPASGFHEMVEQYLKKLTISSEPTAPLAKHREAMEKQAMDPEKTFTPPGLVAAIKGQCQNFAGRATPPGPNVPFDVMGKK